MTISRRKFIAGAVAAASFATFTRAARAACPFRVAVINDEISQDFDHVCSVVAHDFGLQWIELRSMWGKNVTDMPDADIERAQAPSSPNTTCASPTLPARSSRPTGPARRYPNRASTAISSAPTSTSSSRMTCSSVASRSPKPSSTDRIRCFDFWRLDNVAPYRVAINEKLRDAARRCGAKTT